jgi:hypothetical protein
MVEVGESMAAVHPQFGFVHLVEGTHIICRERVRFVRPICGRRTRGLGERTRGEGPEAQGRRRMEHFA